MITIKEKNIIPLFRRNPITNPLDPNIDIEKYILPELSTTISLGTSNPVERNILRFYSYNGLFDV